VTRMHPWGGIPYPSIRKSSACWERRRWSRRVEGMLPQCYQIQPVITLTKIVLI